MFEYDRKIGNVTNTSQVPCLQMKPTTIARACLMRLFTCVLELKKKFFNCSIYQGSLASIHDSDTNSLLNTLSNGSTVWLGGYRIEENELKDWKANKALLAV